MWRSFLPEKPNPDNPRAPLWDNANRFARVAYRAHPYTRIALRALWRGVRASDLARTQFPFLFPDAKKPPILTIELCNTCNLRCKYCFTLLPNKKNGVMSRETLERVLEDIRHLQVERVRLIGGGEPTLHPEFPTYVRRIAREARFLSITTNAHWPSVQIPKSLVDAPVDLVEISIDAGGKAQYEASRVRGNYEVLMGNLERLYKMRKEAKSRTMINIRLMVRPSNKSQLQDDIKLYKRYSDTVMPQYLQSVELLNYNEDVYMPAYHHSQQTPKCSMPFKHMEVLWNGDIPLCGPNWRGAEHKRLHLGNIHDSTLGEIWNGEIYKQYRSAHRKRIHGDMPVCRGCGGI